MLSSATRPDIRKSLKSENQNPVSSRKALQSLGTDIETISDSETLSSPLGSDKRHEISNTMVHTHLFSGSVGLIGVRSSASYGAISGGIASLCSWAL